jgi:large subunit ribosomal protein L23
MNTSLFKKPLISEKSFAEAALGKFTFVVDKKASKEEIKETCEQLFGVNVVCINTANIIGKVKKTRKGQGKRSDYKKAVISLKKGQKIDLFEIETEEDKAKKAKEDKKAEAKKS